MIPGIKPGLSSLPLNLLYLCQEQESCHQHQLTKFRKSCQVISSCHTALISLLFKAGYYTFLMHSNVSKCYNRPCIFIPNPTSDFWRIFSFQSHYNNTVVLYIHDEQKEPTRSHTKRILREIHSPVAVQNKMKTGLNNQILDSVSFSRSHQLQPVTFTSYLDPPISW